MGWFLSNFLKDRFFKVRLADVYSDRFYQRNGVPQGGVLSVPLFAVMVNDTLGVVLYVTADMMESDASFFA